MSIATLLHCAFSVPVTGWIVFILTRQRVKEKIARDREERAQKVT